MINDCLLFFGKLDINLSDTIRSRISGDLPLPSNEEALAVIPISRLPFKITQVFLSVWQAGIIPDSFSLITVKQRSPFRKRVMLYRQVGPILTKTMVSYSCRETDTFNWEWSLACGQFSSRQVKQLADEFTSSSIMSRLSVPGY
jgi:hypothetical protein